VALKKGKALRSAFDTYTIQKQIGAGGSGVAHEVMDSEGSAYAIKILDATRTTTARLKRFKNEIEFCTKNSHKNIIRVLGTGITETGATFYVRPLYSCTLREVMSKEIGPDGSCPSLARF
jgi:serine/threonine protein kinase